jgi:hypothetical protein
VGLRGAGNIQPVCGLMDLIDVGSKVEMIGNDSWPRTSVSCSESHPHIVQVFNLKKTPKLQQMLSREGHVMSGSERG